MEQFERGFLPAEPEAGAEEEKMPAAEVSAENERALPEVLQQIVAAAGEEEEWGEEIWERIDTVLPDFCHDNYALNWARDNFQSAQADLRDLAASLFEISSLELSAEDICVLEKLMGEDEGFAGFRAACALARRLATDARIEPLRGAIETKLEAFADDEDVAGIVAEYIENITKES